MGTRLDEASWALPIRWAAVTLGLFALGFLLDEADEPADLGGEQ